MCLGIIGPLIGGLMSAAGSMMTAKAAEDQARAQAEARNEKMRITLAKNDRIAKDSRKIFNKDANQYSEKKFTQTQDDATADRTAGLDAAVEQVDPSSIPLSGSAPDVVKSELAKRLLDTMQYGKSQAQRLGTVGGYGDAWLRRGYGTAAAGRNIGINQNFTAGNLAILPYQQDMAELAAYKPISPIGGILSGLGSALGQGGGGGGFLSGGVPKTSYTSVYTG